LKGLAFLEILRLMIQVMFMLRGGASSSVYKNIYKFAWDGAKLTVLDSTTLPDNVTHIIVFSGKDYTTNADDKYYARVRGSNGGVFEISWATKTATKLFVPSTSTSGSHAIAVDIVGNIYYANPSAEWLRMYAPPNGPNSF
jgi:hypothetical protein